jgi:hypothetical protein
VPLGLPWRVLWVVPVLGLAASQARAQEPGEDRIFHEGIESKEDKQSTTYDGSLTSTTFYYAESGKQGEKCLIFCRCGHDLRTTPILAFPLQGGRNITTPR